MSGFDSTDTAVGSFYRLVARQSGVGGKYSPTLGAMYKQTAESDLGLKLLARTLPTAKPVRAF